MGVGNRRMERTRILVVWYSGNVMPQNRVLIKGLPYNTFTLFINLCTRS